MTGLITDLRASILNALSFRRYTATGLARLLDANQTAVYHALHRLESRGAIVRDRWRSRCTEWRVKPTADEPVEYVR